MSDKPVIFISHSSRDSEVVNALKQQIENTVTDVLVFATSHPDAIPASQKWLDEILEMLDASHALVVVCSGKSRTSTWVNFEIGYFWKLNRDRKKRGEDEYPIYPLTLDSEQPFGALETLQGKAIDKPDQLRAFAHSLSLAFDGNPDSFSVDAIIKIIEDSRTLRIEPAPDWLSSSYRG